MRHKSLLSEAQQISRAGQLIALDARLQVLEAETDLSRDRLLRLYKEIKHESPPKGMLPFSTDWFMTWQPNIHGSLYMNIYQYLITTSVLDDVDAIIKAYQIYLEHIQIHELPRVLSFTRAWRLTKFFDAGMLTLSTCRRCHGKFVNHTYELVDQYVCGLCHMPSRAGKIRSKANKCNTEH
jgi:flagellar transcriptional activator FlhC